MSQELFFLRRCRPVLFTFSYLPQQGDSCSTEYCSHQRACSYHRWQTRSTRRCPDSSLRCRCEHYPQSRRWSAVRLETCRYMPSDYPLVPGRTEWWRLTRLGSRKTSGHEVANRLHQRPDAQRERCVSRRHRGALRSEQDELVGGRRGSRSVRQTRVMGPRN